MVEFGPVGSVRRVGKRRGVTYGLRCFVFPPSCIQHVYDALKGRSHVKRLVHVICAR